MKLILTRHGQTEENVRGIIQGQMQGNLTGKGISQAEKLAQRLKPYHIDHIFSSDLKRAADTAKIIAKFHPEAEFILSEKIREKHFGKWEGKRKEDFGYEADKSVAGVEMEGAESFPDLYKRASEFLEMLIEKHKNDTVLVVGHSGICKTIVAVMKGLDPYDIPSVETLENTGVSVFDISSITDFKTVIYNDVSHL